MIKSRSSTQVDSNYRRFSFVAKERISPIQWVEIPELTNKIFSTYHVIDSIDGFLFVHGGIKQQGSQKPSNDFYRINMKTYHIDNLTNNESPHLSQHASVVFSNRYLLLIGGWDGHVRTSDVYIFDSQTSKWLKRPAVDGFHKGAGLSSHTANAVLQSHSTFPEIIVIGREGSTRIQRRYGNAYRLSCNNDLTKFTYTELQLDIASRSGHCTSVIHSKLYIVGGRDDKVIDVHNIKDLTSDRYCNVVSNISCNFQKYDFQVCPLAGKRKAGRKGHCLIPGKNGFIVTGGSSFIEATNVADSAGFLYTMSPENYYFLGSIDNSRAYGAFAIDGSLDAFYHGGIDVHGKIRSEFLKLKLAEN